jgi:very-short-patch-repair endonuclease
MTQYNSMTDDQKKQFIMNEYEQKKRSFKDIADGAGTYANKIRRDAIKYNIKIRDKSEAQKNALNSGKTDHPTKGKQRSSETKKKIGLSVLQSWEQIDDDELEKRKNKARDNWNKLSDDQKQNILKEANNAVRQSSKTGSKLELYLLDGLLKNGHSVEFHKEQSLLNTKLQIDLFLPKHNIAIEVDGPSHFEPVWGDDALSRNKKYDDKKSGLILGKGLFLIRIKQSKDFSNARANIILDDLLSEIANIQKKIKTDNTRIICI